MTDSINDNFVSLHSNILTGDDLLNCIRGMPSLLFRIEIAKNRIEYLNDYQVEGLGSKTFLLLKNKSLSKEIIIEEDYRFYESFIQAAHNAKPASTIIRIRTENNVIRWIKLTGINNPYNPGFYLGVLMDLTPSVETINRMQEKENENLAMLNMLDNPVILIDMATKQIISHNVAAHELFGYSFNEFRGLKFHDLYHAGLSGEINKILEDVMFDKKWEGKIFFRRKGQSRFLCDTSMRTFKIRDKILLRISVHSVDIEDNDSKEEEKESFETLNLPTKTYIQSLLEKITPLSEMKEILEVILDNQIPGATPFEGIMYSDIQLNKDKVIVYAAGKAFENLTFGETFTYDGTIAENIEQYKLKYLIVEDTMSSIKAIDWALFIPYGIRSYYAKPFYERKALRSVLILCSKNTGAFKEDEIDTYDLLATPFVKGLKNWRKSLRAKKSNR